MTLQKHSFILIIFLLLGHISLAQKSADKAVVNINENTKTDYLSQNQISITDSIINYGKLFLNTPYRYGATGISSFDCSGFTSFVYSNFGYDLSRSSSDQAKQFNPIDPENVKTGDLVFFSGRRKSKKVGHVGIVVSKNDDGEFDFIHAAVHSGVTISNSSETYYKNRFIMANRVICDEKLLAVLPCCNNNEVEELVENPIASNNAAVVPVTKETKKTIPAKYHKVKSGENLSVIANKYGLTVAELKRKNSLKNSKIKPSQRLKITDAETIYIVENIQLAENKSVSNNKSADVQEVSTKNSPAIHTVKKGETLFSISKMYNIPVDELKKLNQLNGSSIHFGEILKLNDLKKMELAKAEPIKKDTLKNEISKPDAQNVQLAQNKTHKVVSGETLYSISKIYKISIEELKKINQLAGSSIRPGQLLSLNQSENKTIVSAQNPKQITHKVGSGESFYSIAKDYGCTIDDLKTWNNKTGNKLNKGEKLIVYPKTI